MKLTASAVLDRELFWARGKSVRYLVARLEARRDDDPREAERLPLNLALVIDASGSMADGKLEAAKEAALGLTERLTQEDRLTVVSFASDVVVHLDAMPVTAENAIRIRKEISRLQTRGMTHLSGGWFSGVECAARVAEENPKMAPRVILLSDGHANEGIVDPEELREHAGELRMRGVLTSCLGIGDGYDEQLLRGIAENGGGRLHDAELTSEISSVLLGELDDIFGTVIEDARISLLAPKGVKVEVLGRGNSEVDSDQMVVHLGPIQNQIERVAVFKLTCPKAEKGDVLEFQVTGSGRAVEDGTLLKARSATVSLVAAGGSANTAQQRDMSTVALVARIWSAHVVSEAARMNRDGAYQDAERFIRRELGYFYRYVDGLPQGHEMAAELELLAGRVGHQLSSRMHKEMVLQSSLAMESRRDRRGDSKAAWSARMRRGD
ncbi:VWA domain-containing protein [Qipengyuania gaetbuli]|uniref:vWA domain-containing protein n=1 Tax=Qipengyuania gaetbuli TaxID=266952 RepID=UPI001C99A070|nr:VWA domain-containing protein [Qipengyuania gaetbuli]MBY6014081.1 VWA domain-containing protein [Qipengyuania gaetbuli]